MASDGGDAPAPTGGGWPPPHPSPPLPAPREYGVPGTTPSRTPYVAGAVAVLGVIGLVVLLVVLLGGGDDEDADKATDVPTTRPSASASASASASETAAAPVAAYTCWDGAEATALEECSAPTGEAGLAWVFPVIEQARCGPAAAAGGAVTRVLCLYKLSDGTRAQLGFFEWPSVEAGQAFYDGQGLTRTEATDAVVQWSGADGDQAKQATMYAAEPYSLTVTYAAAAAPNGDDVAALQPRPAAEVRGVAAQ